MKTSNWELNRALKLLEDARKQYSQAQLALINATNYIEQYICSGTLNTIKPQYPFSNYQSLYEVLLDYIKDKETVTEQFPQLTYALKDAMNVKDY